MHLLLEAAERTAQRPRAQQPRHLVAHPRLAPRLLELTQREPLARNMNNTVLLYITSFGHQLIILKRGAFLKPWGRAARGQVKEKII